VITSLKRSAPDSDSENVDPAQFAKTSKRKRSGDNEDDGQLSESPKALKINYFSLASVESKATRSTPLSTEAIRPSTPPTSSIGKPAGRSPQSKKCRVFGRRSSTTSPRPDSVAKRSVFRAPFSLSSALSAKKRKRTNAPKPASWNFDIYADTAEDEASNMMQHSACFLDISDDESKTKDDSRGKENIPPHELGIIMPIAVQQPQDATAAPVTRKNMMTDEPRSPLGELKASDYYADGLHGLSYAVVDDDDADIANAKSAYISNVDMTSNTFSKSTPELLSAQTIATILAASAPVETFPEPTKTEEQAEVPTEAEVEIWESDSATEEAVTAASEAAETTSIFA
jgi:hypothetical protein